MKEKNLIKCAITLIIAGLLIAGSTSAIVLATSENEDENNSIQVIKSDKVMHKLQMNKSPVEVPQKHISQPLGHPEFAHEGYQLHPAFGSAGNQYMAAYQDEAVESIVWASSPEDGVYYSIGALSDYPSIKHWGDTRFFGTFVPDTWDDDANIFLFECTDPADTETYYLAGWDWSDNGWSYIMDMEIACDNSQESWEWGFISLVASTTYGEGVSDGPFISYQTSEDGYATISWYYLDDCAHTDADIDRETHKTYAVYDCLVEGSWELFIRVDRFDNWDGSSNLYEVIGAGNLEYPAVAAYSNDMVLLAETDENGNKDIVCTYGTPQSPKQSFVTTDAGDERFPDVRHVEGETFVCTFVKDNALFSSITEDAGETWSTPVKVEDDVVAEYKTADITDLGGRVMYEVDSGVDVDIWLAELEGASAPFIEIDSISGGMGVSATIKNTGTADATDVEWTLIINGGMLGMINKEISGTISNLAVGAETTISSGLIVGLGAIEITATADTAQETVSGKQILIFTMV